MSLVDNLNMLEGLFGNKSAEKVMLAIFKYGEIHASAIAKEYNTALDPIKKQLERFEEAGFLISRLVGRSRLYKFNDSHPIVNPLRDLLLVANNNSIKKNDVNGSHREVNESK